MTKPENVIQALAAVAAEVGAITKDRQVQHGDRFKYRGIDDVLNALHGPMTQHGVVIVPRKTMVERLPRPEYGSRDGKPSNWFEERGLVQYRIYGPGGREDFIDVEVPTSALDNSDKASGKVLSYAFKSLAFQVFTIPTDNSLDNEAFHEDSEPQGRGRRGRQEPTAEELAEMEAVGKLRQELLDDIGVLSEESKAVLRAWMKEQGLKLDSREAIEKVGKKYAEVLEAETGTADADVDPDAPVDVAPAEYPQIERGQGPTDAELDEAAASAPWHENTDAQTEHEKEKPARRSRRQTAAANDPDNLDPETVKAIYAYVTGGGTQGTATDEQSKEALAVMRGMRRQELVLTADGDVVNAETGELYPKGGGHAEAA